MALKITLWRWKIRFMRCKVDSGPHGCPLILLPGTCEYVSLPGLRNSAAMIKLRGLSWIDYSEWSRRTHCNHKGPEEKTGYQKGEEGLIWWLQGKDCLPAQESQVWSLVWEDPTCLRATKPGHHNYGTCTLESCSAAREITAEKSLCAVQKLTPALHN